MQAIHSSITDDHDQARIWAILRGHATFIGNSGDLHFDCPKCGKEAKHGQTHFHVVARSDGYFYKCQRCGDFYGRNLGYLAKQLNIDVSENIIPKRIAGPLPGLAPNRRKQRWMQEYDAILAKAGAHDHRLAWWREYRPKITLDIMAKGQFGIGVVPGQSICLHERLIYPVYENGLIMDIRGRRRNCACPAKWLSAGGGQTALYGIDQVEEGDTIIAIEAPVDTWFINALEIATVKAIAPSTGAGTWKPEWTQILVERKIRHALVAFDNDPAGCPSPRIWNAHRREFFNRMRREPAQPHGWKLTLEFLKAGLPTTRMDWPNDQPEHADVGDLLQKEAFRL